MHRPLRGTGGSEPTDESAGHAPGATSGSGPNPCELVSRKQAQAIVGTPVATPQEAPLGPTCIYQPRKRTEQITVDVEPLDFAKIRPMIRGAIRVSAANHTVYCGRYGRPTTFVPVAHGNVLNIAAPCAIGIQFAETAIRQLGPWR